MNDYCLSLKSRAELTFKKGLSAKRSKELGRSAIAMLTKEKWKTPERVPLLLDGLLAFDDTQIQAMAPLDPNKMEFGSPWTAWRGAVDGPAPRKRGRRARGLTKLGPAAKRA